MFKKSQQPGGSNEEQADPVPQSLKEVIVLMESINRNIEDCAVECQSKVSKKQWKMLNTEYGAERNWDPVLLTRTYFDDKILDDAFHKLLAYVRSFMEYLNNFIALLQGERSVPIPGNTKDAEIQITESLSQVNKPSSSVMAPLDLSILDNQSSQYSERRRSKRLAANSTSNVQQRFADLIKAKIELDTKFLGFEAVLNGGAPDIAPARDEICCLCQICSNVLGTVIDNQKILNEAVTKPKLRRTVRSSPKKLQKSARLWKKNDNNKKQSVSLTNISEKPMLSPKNVKNA